MIKNSLDSNLNNRYDNALEVKDVRLMRNVSDMDESHRNLVDFRRFEERHYVEVPIYFCS